MEADLTTFLLTWVAIDIVKQLYVTVRRFQLRWIARKRGRAVVGSGEFNAYLAREARIVAHLRKLNISSKDEAVLDELLDIAFQLLGGIEARLPPDHGVWHPMESDLTCCFDRALLELRLDERPSEYEVTRHYHEASDQTEFRVSWVGSSTEVPEWLSNATYEVEKRWVRHFLSRRAKGNVQGTAIFDAPEVRELAQQYIRERYGA